MSSKPLLLQGQNARLKCNNIGVGEAQGVVLHCHLWHQVLRMRCGFIAPTPATKGRQAWHAARSRPGVQLSFHGQQLYKLGLGITALDVVEARSKVTVAERLSNSEPGCAQCNSAAICANFQAIIGVSDTQAMAVGFHFC